MTTTLPFIVWAFLLAPSPCQCHDIHRFPGLATCELALEFNEVCRSHVRKQKDADKESKLWIVEEHIQEAREPWNYLKDAHLQTCPCKKERQLEGLRNLIGCHAYNQSIMPPPVPLYYFKEIEPNVLFPRP
jgi:hypothetical protein